MKDTAPNTETSRGPGRSRGSLLRWAGWFALANVPLLLLVSWRHWQALGWPDDGWARLFLPVAALGHYLTLALVPVLPALLFALAWPRRWLVQGVGIGLSSLLVVGLFVDGVVFSLYRFHLNGMVWNMIANGHLAELLPLSVQTLGIAVVVVVGVFLAEAGLGVAVWRWVRQPRRHGVRVAVVALVILVAGQGMHTVATAAHHTPITKIPRVLPAFRPLTANRLLRRLGWLKPGNEAAIRLQSGRTALNYPREPLVLAPPSSRTNLVILAIDGWRFDLLTEAITPNLWRFSSGALRFEDHSSAANATRFGLFTLFYGVYGTYWHAMLSEERGPVLIHELKQAGYQFGAWGAAPLTTPEFDRTVFSEVRDQITLQVPGARPPDRDREITRRFQQFLEQRDRTRPFFAFVFYDSTHGYEYPADAPAPFQPDPGPINHLELNARTDPVPIRNRFMNAAHYVDSLAAQVLGRLEAEGLLNTTVVVITADHGQEFNDTGLNYWGHNSNFSRYQTHVPFLLHWPGLGAGVVRHPTTHLDVAPTLLRHLLGCTNAPETFSHGRRLFDFSQGRLVFDDASRFPYVIGNWNRFAILSPGRIDVVLEAGPMDHYDPDYRELDTPPPVAVVRPAMDAMARFFAR